MATQISYAQGFLDQLASLPITITPDHVEDPRRFPARPAFTLPKMPTPMTKRNTPSATSPPHFLSITLKSPRNPPLTISLPAQEPTTSIGELRTIVAQRTQTPLPKVKILYNKKPAVDSKTLKELLGDVDVAEVELGIMIMGGAAVVGTAAPVKEVTDEKLEDGDGAAKVLKSEEFWKQLEVFVANKVGSTDASKKLVEVFRVAYESKE